MTQPAIADVYCKAGGAGYGYHLAEFIQADALDVLADPAFLARFDAIHTSPPCQNRSRATPDRASHPALIGATRALLVKSGLPWIIENVPPAPGTEPLRPDLKLCGCIFGLDRLERERWFETSWHAFDLRQPCTRHSGPAISVLRKGARVEQNRRREPTHHYHIPHAEASALMGIGWMTQVELGEAIPPVYTEYIGRLLLAHLEAAA
jgi:DNA (cytosine-5)-methyltransferase 1